MMSQESQLMMEEQEDNHGNEEEALNQGKI
jgi:hypothetical protein